MESSLPQQQQIEIKKIAECFNLYRNKHILKTESGWITSPQYLKNKFIAGHVQGYLTVGAFLLYATDIFAFDVDNHNTDNDLFNNVIILNRYNYLVQQFGHPSIVFRSSNSGGLHCYYKLQAKYPFIVIQQAVNTKIKKLPKGIDFLPTPEHAIRLPFAIKDGGLLLDIKTLHPVSNITASKMVEALDSIEKKHFIEIFDFAPSGFLLRPKTKKAQIKNFQGLKKLSKIEKDLFPIIEGAGNRNRKVEQLSFIYYCTGLDVNESVQRILNNMEGAGRDYREQRLEKQITLNYKRFEDKKERIKFQEQTVKKERQVDLFQEVKINNMVTVSPFTSRRKKGFKKFLTELYHWKGYIEGLNYKDRVYLNFLYPYFWYNTINRKLIPLPQSLLLQWNQRFIKFMDLLQEKKIIELKQQYSTTLGVCKYYTII